MNSIGPASNLLSQALGLPVEDREALALDLLASLPPEDESRTADESLGELVRQRIAERDAGHAKTIDSAEFAARVRAAARSDGER